MSDKELLELAAKAAGYDFFANIEGAFIRSIKSGRWINWNPLADDGDAFRLSVKLEFSWHRKRGAIGISSQMFEGYVWESFDIEANDDVIATATRRAITRAAAAIGEKL